MLSRAQFSSNFHEMNGSATPSAAFWHTVVVTYGGIKCAKQCTSKIICSHNRTRTQIFNLWVVNLPKYDKITIHSQRYVHIIPSRWSNFMSVPKQHSCMTLSSCSHKFSILSSRSASTVNSLWETCPGSARPRAGQRHAAAPGGTKKRRVPKHCYICYSSETTSKIRTSSIVMCSYLPCHPKFIVQCFFSEIEKTTFHSI